MAKKEQFGKFVLLQETDRHGWGSEYRAAKLGSAGLERIVTVTRLAPSISNDAMVAGQLMEQFRFAAQLQNPEITRVLAIGRVGSSHYVCSELVEGKPLKAMFARSRQEGFPSSLEHALLIAPTTESP